MRRIRGGILGQNTVAGKRMKWKAETGKGGVVRQKGSVFEDPTNQPRLPSQNLGWENFSTPGKRLGHPQDAHPFFLSTDRQHKK